MDCETAPTRNSSNLAADPTSWSSTYSIQHSATTKKHPSYNIAPCDKHSTSKKTTTLVKTNFLTHPTSVGGAKTSINALRISATVSHWWLGRVSTPPTAARARSSSLDISDIARGATQHLVKQLLREVLPIWQPIQLPDHPPTASNTVPPQKNTHPTTLHHATNIQLRSKIQVRLKPMFWRTQPPLGAPRLPSTRCASLLQWATGGWVVSPHHPQQPGREAHLLIFPT